MHDSSAYRGCIPRPCLLMVLSLIGNLFWLATPQSLIQQLTICSWPEMRTGAHIAHTGEARSPISYNRYPLLNPVKFLHIYIHTQFRSCATSNCSELLISHNKETKHKAYIHTYQPTLPTWGYKVVRAKQTKSKNEIINFKLSNPKIAWVKNLPAIISFILLFYLTGKSKRASLPIVCMSMITRAIVQFSQRCVCKIN